MEPSESDRATQPIRVLIVDDDPLAREGLRTILASSGDIDVVAEAPDGAASVEASRAHHPDVVLMDVRMPGMSGSAATALILTQTRTRVLAMTSFDGEDAVYDMLEAGAAGFLLKDASPQEIISAVRVVMAGEGFVSPRATTHLIKHFGTDSNHAAHREAANRFASLSEQESKVAKLIASGASNDDIATQLHLSVSTVKTHLEAVRDKLGARNRALIAAAVERAGFGPKL